MNHSPVRHRTAIKAVALVVGLTLGLSAMPIYPCEDAKEDPVTKSRSSDTQPRDTGTRTVADVTTNASASATANASSSSRGKGDCVAESSASAKARSGDETKEDHDSARDVSADGDCEARSSSKASARTGGGPPSGEAEKE